MSFDPKNCIQSLDHTGFIVKDLDKSIDFYVNKLGFELKMRWYETAEQCQPGMGNPGGDLELAKLVGYGTTIEVSQYLHSAGSDAPIEPNRIGVGHASFIVNDLPALVAYLEEQGVEMAPRMIVPELNITWVHVFDPDGIRVEFMQFFD
ncbi:MAG: VOC family protein [Oscillospiraceae bacterium]|nr:VOC family protein [Oscillospiraceae bacterium]